MSCKSCGSRGLSQDADTGYTLCSSCGFVQDAADNLQAYFGGVTSEKGNRIHVGSSGRGSVLNYKDKKIFEANKTIDDITFRLNLSPSTTAEIKTLISKITDGEFGLGEWFSVLIGACSYVVMRRDRMVLPLCEIENVIGKDLYVIGRMVNRVVDHICLKLPEFDIVMFFEKTLSNSPRFRNLDRDKMKMIRKHGSFMMNCAIKWFLTTGRRPGPMVAAVLLFVAEINGVNGCRIEDLAKEVHSAVGTCKQRYNEILIKLVEVAKVLPWGKDLNVKNIVKNAASVISYMELKSMEKVGKGESMELTVGFDMDEVLNLCVRKDVEYGEEEEKEENDARYFDIDNRDIVPWLEGGDIGRLEISHECLAMIYRNFADEVDSKLHVAESEKFRTKKGRGFEVPNYTDWWNGKSELSKKLLLKDIMEKNVGLDPMPLSFVRGCTERQARREKIRAAKCRIGKIMHSLNNDSDISCYSDNEGNVKKKKRRRKKDGDIDWDDLVIETLLLHQVKEEEIENGHYHVLLDLHVFN
ncbi:plant-specific TFIIB-related protein PTF2-like [Rutidosis leptorrhynchoides]|uniref:plant-specific TFIIB-related protein PTF2-like n=1 Tax=Rutidosis leptorrhynchoides TaxID=125765 RepID=UPI003A9A59B5